MTDITEALEKDLLSELLCSSCKSYLSISPILMNKNGENICGRCKITPKTEAFFHNTVYESLASRFQFPCTFTRDGCNVKEIFNDIGMHEANCPFRLCKCKFNYCKWSGNVVDLIIHYNMIHTGFIVKNDTPKQIVQGQHSFLFAAYGYHFLLDWNFSETKLQIQLKPLNIIIPDSGITFICRFFSSDPHKPTLALDAVELNTRTVFPLASPCTEEFLLMFSIHALIPDEYVFKKVESLKKLECHNCNRQMSIPIFSCSQEHVSCVDCAGPDSNFCSECQDTVIFNRVTKLELVAAGSMYNCKWDECTLQFSYKKIRLHEQSCFKRKYTCLYCLEWQGMHDEIIKHDRFCRSKYIFCPMSINTQVTVLGIRTGELHYALLAFRELFVVSFLLRDDSAEVTIVNFGPASFLKWYQFEAEMVHVIEFDSFWNRTYQVARDSGNRYKLSIPSQHIANFGGNEFYKLTVKILKSNLYLK